MRIGIIGSGDVGRALGTGFATLGYEVKIGTRDPGKQALRDWVSKAGSKSSVGSFADAAAYGDVVVLATLWSGTENAIKMANPKNLESKVVIDVTNPLMYHDKGPPTLALGFNDSAGEQVQRWLPKSRVVKCWNIVGNAHMFKPSFPGGPPDMFFAGNDAKAKDVVTKMLGEFGWPATDIGGIEGSRILEPLCILWVTYGIRNSTWNHALKMLRK